MSNLDIIEMVADWTAISQEQNADKGTCLTWAELNLDKKWCFSSEKKELIYKTIHEIDYRRKFQI